MQVVTISSKRQITIPKKFLESLMLRTNGKAILKKDSGRLVLEPIETSIIDELAGSLTKYVHHSKLGVPFKKAKEKAMREVVKDLAKKL